MFRLVEVLKRQVRTITIEPVVAFYTIGFGIVYGAQINTDLLYWKSCLELGYPESSCDNITQEGFDDPSLKLNVTNYVTEFQMYSGWMYSIPVIVFAIISGSLSDRFGRKPLILFPILGSLIAHLMATINFTLIRQLPIGFFYAENLAGLFGGYAVYYMGVYSYGTNVTTPQERSRRLARYDGVEVVANMVGTVLSPVLGDRIGFYGTYGVGSGSMLMALFYLVFFVNEPVVVEEGSGGEKGLSFARLLQLAILAPLEGLRGIVTKKRVPGLKVLILLQVVLFTLYWTTSEAGLLGYNYLKLVFDSFDGGDYATYMFVYQLANTFYLVAVIPTFTGTFRLHDATILCIVLFVEGVGNVLTAFSSNLVQFYLSQVLVAISLCKYSMVRSLLSKCIASDEVGKVFSVLAVMAAFAPVGGSAMFRSLFNSTSVTFPSAFYLLSGLLSLLAAAGNLLLYFKRASLTNEDHVSQQSNRTKIGPTPPTHFGNTILSSM